MTSLGAEKLRLHRRVDRGHAAADHDGAPPDVQRRGILGLAQARDEVDRVLDAVELLARHAEIVHRAEPEAEEHRVEVAGEPLERDVDAEHPRRCTSVMPPIDSSQSTSACAKSFGVL